MAAESVETVVESGERCPCPEAIGHEIDGPEDDLPCASHASGDDAACACQRVEAEPDVDSGVSERNEGVDGIGDGRSTGQSDATPRAQLASCPRLDDMHASVLWTERVPDRVDLRASLTEVLTKRLGRPVREAVRGDCERRCACAPHRATLAPVLGGYD